MRAIALRIARDPLTHFLIAGGIIFAAWAAFGPQDRRNTDETTIHVDQQVLLNYMQYRSSAFEPGYFKAQWDAMSAAEKRLLADNYIREEAMVREARSLGLDQVDYVIRQRLIQKVLFLVDGTSPASGQITPAALEDYFNRHRADYAKPATLTFTHVFIDNEKRHAGGAQAMAQRIKADLQARNAGFNDAPAYGDRFAYLQNYVDRDTSFIANQFGPQFSAALEKLQPSQRWQGPVASAYGYHLVMLTSHTPAAQPQLADVAEQVEADYLASKSSDLRDAAIDDLLAQYTIEIEGLGEMAPPGD